MSILLATTLSASRSNGARRARASFLVAGVLMALAAAPALGATPAGRSGVEEDVSHKGLGPNVPVPAWAVHKRIHFFPASPPSASLTGGLAEQGVSGRPKAYAGRRCERGYCPEPPLLYNEGGKGVQHTPHLHIIFWGSNWNNEAGSALRTQLLKMYEGLSGSAYQGILTQYFDATGRVSSTVTVTSYTDTGVAAPTNVDDAKIQEEVIAAVKANEAKGWALEFNAEFVVIPGPGATYEPSFPQFCAYHDAITSGTNTSTYTFAPDAAEEPFYGLCASYDPTKNGNNVTSMLATHEYAESATDPIPGPATHTWTTANRYEIGDICASGDDEVKEGSLKGSWVQGLWDDNQSLCSLEDPAPPHVYAITGRPTTMSLTEATLYGTVNPEGLETKYYFEYGSTTSYGSKTSEVSAGPGVSNLEINQSVGGLTAEQTYHYRLVATNSTGTTHGEDHTIVTSRWYVRPTPNVSGGTNLLESVSCVSSSFCIAVGVSERSGKFPLAEQWNGTEWSI
ncbi:MAG TPA: hypothetical protein VHS55_03850, partial [Solirubrobacteraceae bacterium]|nr:hypothetical protein [Solirubrobacteraceae bacterium]